MDTEPDRHEPAEISRFECRCGRHVVTEKGSETDRRGCCSRCRRSRLELLSPSLTR